MTSAGVVHRDHEAIEFRELRGDRAAQIGRGGSDAALARQVIAEDRDLAKGFRWETRFIVSPLRHDDDQMRPRMICTASHIATRAIGRVQSRLVISITSSPA